MSAFRSSRSYVAALAAVVVAAPVPAYAQSPSRSASVLQSADSTILNAAIAIARTASGVEQIWPRYRPKQGALALLRPPETILLVTSGRPPAGYAAVRERSLPRELRGRVYLRRGPLPNVDEHTFGTAVALGTDTIWAVAPMGSDSSDFFRKLEFYYHEHFHLAHQRGGKFVETPEARRRARFGQPLVDPAHLTPKFATMAELERRMLSAALEIADVDSLRTHLRRYLAVRRERAGTLLDVVEVERRMERDEGTAMYVGCKAAALATAAPLERAVACILKELERDLEKAPKGPEADARLMRWRLYGTGGAIALLLDRLRPGWKPLVEQGMHLDQLLAQAVDFDPTKAVVAHPG